MVLKRRHVQELTEQILEKLEETGINVLGAEEVVREAIIEYLDENE